MLRDYTLVPGDLVKVDTGIYVLDSTLLLFDSGSATQQIHYLGSTHPDGTVIDRNDSGNDALLVAGTSYIRFEKLRLTRGGTGLTPTGNLPTTSVASRWSTAKSMATATMGFCCSTAMVRVIQRV